MDVNPQTIAIVSQGLLSLLQLTRSILTQVDIKDLVD